MSSTKDKYMMVLQYIAAQKTFHSQETLRQFKISNNFLTAAKELGLITRVENSMYRWALNRAPMMQDSVGIVKRIVARSKDQRLKNTPPKQLTIKPLKRVERFEPPVAPSYHSNEMQTNTTYPLMDVAIAFLAGAVVAGMISLIWK